MTVNEGRLTTLRHSILKTAELEWRLEENVFYLLIIEEAP